MTLLPWWKELNPHFLFIHVLRDGRDIAFSANQVKFSSYIRCIYIERYIFDSLSS